MLNDVEINIPNKENKLFHDHYHLLPYVYLEKQTFSKV